MTLEYQKIQETHHCLISFHERTFASEFSFLDGRNDQERKKATQKRYIRPVQVREFSSFRTKPTKKTEKNQVFAKTELVRRRIEREDKRMKQRMRIQFRYQNKKKSIQILRRYYTQKR